MPPSNASIPVNVVVSCSGLNLESVNSHKYLVAVLDSNIDWSDKILYLSKKVSRKIGAFQRAGKSLITGTK